MKAILPTPPGLCISEWLSATYQVGWTFRRQFQLCRKAGVSTSCNRDRYERLLPQEKVTADALSKFGAGFYICGMDDRMLCAGKHCRELCNRIQAATQTSVSESPAPERTSAASASKDATGVSDVDAKNS